MYATNQVDQLAMEFGDSILGTIADIQARAGEYQAILSSVVDRTSNILTYLPQSGNYSGNGANDWWNKVEALNETFHIDPSHDLATEHSPQNLAVGQKIQGNYDHALAGHGDPFNIDPHGAEDVAAMTHDQTRGVAAYMGDAVGVVEADLIFGIESAANFLNDFNPYDLAAAGLIGLGTVGLDVVQSVADVGWNVMSNLLGLSGSVAEAEVTSFDYGGFPAFGDVYSPAMDDGFFFDYNGTGSDGWGNQFFYC
jgi:hypothetical protein